MLLCRRCANNEATTSDGFCRPCKKKEVLHRKLELLGRRQKATNTILSGGIA